MAADPVFVDTNVLVFANQRNASEHHAAREVLVRAQARDVPLWVSTQVLREYIVVATRRGPQTGRVLRTVLVDIERITASLRLAYENESTPSDLRALLRQVPCYGKQVHDANIVATMLKNGIATLLTFNIADFRRFESMISVIDAANSGAFATSAEEPSS